MSPELLIVAGVLMVAVAILLRRDEGPGAE
jgi:hypothetical protein